MNFFGLIIISTLMVISSLVMKATSESATAHYGSPSFSASENKKLNILAALFTSSGSHFTFFKPLLEELARRGHNLTVLSYNPRKNNTMDTKILHNYKDVLLTDPKLITRNVVNVEKMVSNSYFINMGKFFRLRELGLKYCEMTFNNTEVRELIKSDQRFDLIFMETFSTDCALGFVHRFQAPFIALSSHEIMPWINDRLGNPDNPSYIPEFFKLYSGQMRFMQRVMNTLGLWWAKFIYEIAFQCPNQKLVEDTFGPEVPPLSEIAKKTSALLVNTHYSIHGSRPYVPNVIEVGGMHIGEPKPLPDDIQKFLDNARKGALLFSWGSMVNTSTLTQKKLDALLNVFEKMPRKVILKWEYDEFPRKMKNVMIKKWLPQFDIMNHPNVKAYLSHGGLLGLSEGVYVGIPMVIVPMYGDQFHNAAAAAARGAAVIVRYDELDEITLKSALDKVFNDTRYQENARALSRAYRDRPASPLETAVWWSEFIARGNGRPYLRSEGADLPWYQYYLLDVFLFLTVILLTAFYATYRLMKFLLFLCCFRKSCKTTESSSAIGKKTKRKNE
ncbi:UDP-glucuronosyltransferase 2B15-like isoform X2 [Belonocnema kinseyi]|uniref:UDP-glucuronosyltransferase 2B15-like isoform X2 n=1 Tax=Belonocnema kinseyi TaxID=2817044 RepID=UPI00143D1FBA|nr:UDP-glucuronosyltransferase 2B15-like isoform X2 [Belonocnema kinseyi]XP_033229947.1 UDP-glucuronosyltransferase 2B15-like isoform X2 [Belonocnema kinseyi]XP_033229949.1 UDP-glucuronosyltransferase 2B15-like isoform X2 [Belonocnema kinseyi]XP_033229950.1 UDP-glucuronosyltransferase 2B15-like isoform X2 [Belonocnema kinseyi]